MVYLIFKTNKQRIQWQLGLCNQRANMKKKNQMIRNHFQNLAVFLSDYVTANLHGKSNYFQPLVFVNKQTIQYVNKGNHDSD